MFIHLSAEQGDRYKVIDVIYDEQSVPEDILEEGIVVSRIPIADPDKTPTGLYYNPINPEFYFEYKAPVQEPIAHPEPKLEENKEE